MSVGGFGNGGVGIITDGLVFFIDPYNMKSYISGSTISYDLVNSTSSGCTFYNSVPFDGKGWGFNGSNQYGIIGYESQFDLSNTDYTLEQWVSMDDFAAIRVSLSKDVQGSNYDWGIRVDDANTIKIFSNATATNVTATVPTMSVGTPQHICITSISDNFNIYLNGVSYGTGSMTTTNADTEGVTIGCASSNIQNSFWYGGIFLTKIYHKGLSPSEVSQNYNALKGRFINWVEPYVVPTIPTLNLVSDWNPENDVYTDAGSTLAIDTQAVQEWHDQIGGVIAEQISGASFNPTYRTTGGSISKSYLDFDGTNEYMQILGSNVLYTDDDMSIYIVCELDTSAQYDTLFHRGEDWEWNTGWVMSMDDNSGTISSTLNDWVDNELIGSGGTINTVEVRSMRFRTSSAPKILNNRVNNTNESQLTLGVGNDTNNAPNKNALIGASWDSSSGPYYQFDGKIYRILIYNSYHDDTTYSNTITTLMSEYS